MDHQIFPVDIPNNIETPALLAAIAEAVPAQIIEEWIRAATDHRGTGAYIAMLASDKSLQYPYAGDDYSVAVINAADYASYLEDGRGGFHLPDRWTKWKIGKNGNRYAYVRFRVNTPAGGEDAGSTNLSQRRQMPAAVYARAATLGNKGRLAGFGDTYKQSKSYNLFRQMFSDFPSELGGAGYTWKASQYEGLTHVEAPGGGQGEYYTVRTITPESEGWYIPPTPGYHFAQIAMDAAIPRIEAILDEAAAADLASALNDALEAV